MMNDSQHSVYEMARAQIENATHNAGLLPKSRETALVITKLDEALMWLDRMYNVHAKTAAGADSL